MKENSFRIDRNRLYTLVLVVIAVAVNVLLNRIVELLELPIYLDTIGTVTTSMIAGMFPGIITAMLTNLLCMLHNTDSLYFAIVSVLIAIFVAQMAKTRKYKGAKAMILMILGVAFISWSLSACIQWVLYGKPQNPGIADDVEYIYNATHLPRMLIFLFLNLLVNIVDKGISVGIATLVTHIIPTGLRYRIRNSGWMQKPLSDGEIRSMKEWGSDIGHSIGTRMTLIMVGIAAGFTIVISLIGMRLNFETLREEKINVAKNTAMHAASVIDPARVDEYLRKGEAAEGYAETREKLFMIRKYAIGVEYLYALKIRQDGCYYIFDLDTEDVEAYAPGEHADFEEAFLEYLPMLFDGEEIDPIESNDENNTGWVITAYYPVRDNEGKTVCYVGADVYMPNVLRDSLKSFGFKALLILPAFFVLILAFGLWNTGIYTTYPINSIAESVDRFVSSGDSQETFDEDVRKLRSLNIHTGDEVEKLYNSICRMALNQAEQMRAVRHYAEVSSKMQNGLIITMADMVENRDSDTGAHVQKTSAYARIIAEGLKRKGYYAEKITPEFISAVVMSAPLHDVGKIAIPDGVLNKPGKLTDEEYAIMKRHTIEGRKIMEKAISTVKGENYLKEARNMAAYHHERWDGKGYPEGLHGEVIPLSARIMSVADVFDALASPRVYKPAFPLDKALSIIQEGAGTQFDPRCVEVFMESLHEVKEVLRKYQES